MSEWNLGQVGETEITLGYTVSPDISISTDAVSGQQFTFTVSNFQGSITAVSFAGIDISASISQDGSEVTVTLPDAFEEGIYVNAPRGFGEDRNILEREQKNLIVGDGTDTAFTTVSFFAPEGYYRVILDNYATMIGETWVRLLDEEAESLADDSEVQLVDGDELWFYDPEGYLDVADDGVVNMDAENAPYTVGRMFFIPDSDDPDAGPDGIYSIMGDYIVEASSVLVTGPNTVVSEGEYQYNIFGFDTITSVTLSGVAVSFTQNQNVVDVTIPDMFNTGLASRMHELLFTDGTESYSRWVMLAPPVNYIYFTLDGYAEDVGGTWTRTLASDQPSVADDDVFEIVDGQDIVIYDPNSIIEEWFTTGQYTIDIEDIGETVQRAWLNPDLTGEPESGPDGTWTVLGDYTLISEDLGDIRNKSFNYNLGIEFQFDIESVNNSIAGLISLFNPRVINTSPEGFTPVITTDTNNGTIFCIVYEGTVPSKKQIRLGLDSNNEPAIFAESVNVTEAGDIEFTSLTNLTPNTTYRISFVQLGTPN